MIENKQVVELPLNGRSFTELTYLIPGAVRQQGATFQVAGGSRVSVSGARAEDNNYTLDGVNNNETFFKAFAVQPSIDAIQEFSIRTNITSAEFGQAAGANINVVTKSGTNDIHGVLFEFLRNNVFDAREAFAPADDSSAKTSLVVRRVDPPSRTRPSGSSTTKVSETEEVPGVGNDSDP